MEQVIELFSNPVHPLHSRNGGLIGLAAMGIALGVDIAPYMERFIEPLLVCFSDNESRIRYFAAESMYNIAKVSKGEILVYFNPIFDALSKVCPNVSELCEESDVGQLSADSELSVKNGAELLDRLLKDTVADCAPFYVPHHPQSERARRKVEEAYGLSVLVPQTDDTVAVGKEGEHPSAKKAFSLPNFIPLLADRVYVLSPFTRSFLVSWIAVLDSVPDLEMVSYLPHFVDGLLCVSAFSSVHLSSHIPQEIPFRSDRRRTSRDGELARRVPQRSPRDCHGKQEAGGTGQSSRRGRPSGTR